MKPGCSTLATLILLGITACLLLTACPSDDRPANAKRPGEVQLPGGWPILDLVPPDGSTRALARKSKSEKDHDADECITVIHRSEASSYEIGFSTGLDFKAVIRHFDGILAPLEYRISEDEPGELRRYISPDDLTDVVAYYRKDYGTWLLKIEKSRTETWEEYNDAQVIHME